MRILPYFFLNCRFCCSEQRRAERVFSGRHGQGRQEEAHEAHLQWPADLRAGEDLRADQVPGRAGAGQARVRTRHDRVTSQGQFAHTIFILNIVYFRYLFLCLKC